jgi:plastocyanin
MKRIATAVTVLAMAAVPFGVLGCGGDDDSEPAAASTPAAAGTAVEMVDNAFEPKDVSVKVGDKVTWTNAGGIAHTATATEGADFDSGSLASGETFEWTAKKAGSVDYVCTFHPGMEGTITVSAQ